MMTTARRAASLLTRKERRRFVGVVGVTVVTGLVQIAGIGSIIPFMGMMLDPTTVERNPLLASLYRFLGWSDVKTFTLLVGVAALVVLVLGNILAAVTTWVSTWYGSSVHERLSVTLMRWFLQQDYEDLIGRNTAEIQRNVLIESMHFTMGVVMPALNLIAFSLKIALIGAFLVWLKPFVTLVAGAVLASGYLLIYVFVRRPLERNGRRRMNANFAKIQSLQEAFGTLKEVKLHSLENHFTQRFIPHAAAYAHTVTTQRVLSSIPRYGIEALSFGSVVILLLSVWSTGADMQSVLPLTAAFVLAGYRLLPAFQTIYTSAASLRFNLPVLDVLMRDLGRKVPRRAEPSGNRLSFTKVLRLEGVSYQYPESSGPALKNVSLEVAAESFVALVGRTGAGKTTLADLILGVLEPTSGRVSVDGVEITPANLSEWQSIIGYVPQEIYLTDESIAANVAFGFPTSAIDMAAVERAARIANIHDFVVGLPNGYQTIAGERGVRLSGGQRQRIGLARALYRDPQVLVLDEATSALDKATEQEVHDAIFQAAKAKTVIVIAHRMSTILECDRIFVLEDGELVGQGSYQDLVRSSAEFRRIARESGQPVHLEPAEKVAVPS